MAKKLPANLHEYVETLSANERARLIRLLLSREAGATQPLRTGLMAAAEKFLWERAIQAVPYAQAHARGRLWLIFMLLRYGGLRIGEIFELSEQDLSFRTCEIFCKDRIVPLPKNISNRMGAFWNSWPGRASGVHPLACDSSRIRRGLAACAKACGAAPAILNASSLRRQRALELEAGGLPHIIVNFFLGKGGVISPFSREAARTMLYKYITRENTMKTSARNVFRGEIIKLEEQGILVNVTLQTPAGLKVSSIITKTSQENLHLGVGMAATALIKAPWVTVFPENERASAGTENCFQGTVKSIRKDSLAAEILVELPQGVQVCALYANGASPSAGIAEGSEVVISFSAFSVILDTE